jgi:hypothetical protein
VRRQRWNKRFRVRFSFAMPTDLRDAVLELVADAAYQPVKPAVIAKRLGLANEAARELKKIIKQMVKAGELAWGPSHQVYAAGKKRQRKRAGEIASGEDQSGW